jgi:integrase
MTDEIHRTTPIEDSIERIAPYPANFFVYKIPGSKFYQASARLNGVRAKKSLKTKSRTIARQAAREFFDELYSKKAQNLPLVESPNFAKAYESLLKTDQRRIDGGRRKRSTVTDAEYLWEGGIKLFFGKMHCKDVTFPKLGEYIDFLRSREGRKPIKDKTIANHFVIISKILTHGIKLGYLTQLPPFPELATDDTPRDRFDELQYIELLKTIDNLIENNARGPRYGLITKELRLLVSFLVNSYLRPGDIKLLQHKHVTLWTKDSRSYVKIYAQSKVKPSYVFCGDAVVALYSEICRHNKGFTEADDFVFFPKFKGRAHAQSVMAKQFNVAVSRANLKVGPTGVKRTLYSLRHTCLMNRVTNGVSTGAQYGPPIGVQL